MSFYRSIVLVKQTPNTSTVTENALNADGTINRAALPTVLNPEDLNALEAALEVKDRFGGSVTVISMGPPQAAEILREALYRGADRAILICDRAVAGSDVLATSYILSQAIKKAGEFDFIFCGRQAIDGDTGQTGPECAQRLGVPQVSYMVQIVDVDGKKATLRRATGSGWETVTASLPLLASVLAEANEPRPFAAIKVMRHKHKRVPSEVADRAALAPEDRLEEWTCADIDADPTRCGLNGSPTKVVDAIPIVLKKSEYKEFEPTLEGMKALVAELVEERAL